ncbi:hypothetical protein C9374_006321 [Naegleria lovaniensis]|uniref:Mitochondrial carrier protein n=1 Tax=Naegleria lovaniensis TaxID=51637 RepID=A0AA88KHN6_NAELO|nr:uncharacterized protein C9374_006321 [Naegleria lovaniensis]KAG2381332.1 hypothetical protein C9374_006321 [Naegleria lovaniensis]
MQKEESDPNKNFSSSSLIFKESTNQQRSSDRVYERDHQQQHSGSHEVSPLNVVISSALAGCLARITLHPLDTIKSRMQVQITNPELSSKLPSVLFEGGHASVKSSETANLHTYRNTLHAIQSMAKYEGIRGFYKGLGASLIFTGPAITLYLTSYEFCKNNLMRMGHNTFKSDSFLARNLGGETALVHLVSGLFAESVSCIFWVPHDVLKERLQVQRGNQLTLSQLIKIVRHDGFLQLYKGYWITLGSFGPFSAIYFLTYEKVKNFFQQRQTPGTPLPFSLILLSGAVGAGLGSFCTLPLDVIKTRFQVQRRTKRVYSENDIMFYKNFVDAVRKIAKYEGPKAFWKGFTSRIIYAAPNSALIMALFEFFKSEFDFIK